MNKRKKEKYKKLQVNKDINIHDCSLDELNEDMAYGKQRENKLMFFLYILK